VYPNLVYGATGRDVVDVMIGGEWVVQEKNHVRLDAVAVFGALQRAAEQLWFELGTR
jgi:cytosine/adenosine deaminase-related metal-dependent hydrolase